ncbi:hypothetical protein M9H77_29360 [Catharanthus roseus]|uniref:Uncharacterized protein n=1 Tax=Catharanthus roseus TaxID=4058 RepID=A0ACC0AHX9_CATRO|nr:hypothetical protein M9H77_29360 [Catharanthus roseus]
MELFPDLPDDIGIECLIRVPYYNLSSVSSVNKRWKKEIELPEFWRRRKAAGFTRKLVVMAQARVDPTRITGGTKYSETPVYRLTICEPDTGYWAELPPVPGYSDGLPMFCQLAGVGTNLVVMGGWKPSTWEVSNEVFVYNFVSAKWRRGSDMPGCRRSFFACAADTDRTVYVAGGHDMDKNALTSAMAYNVASDEWVALPDMATERDECKGVFHGGKFHVVGGYITDMQGRFGTSAESFDLSTWKWDPVDEDFLEDATCPRTCVDAEDGRMYMCRRADLAAVTPEGNSQWQTVAELPSDVRNIGCVMGWQGKVFVAGCPGLNELYRVYIWDSRSNTWTKVEAPENFSGHIQAACCLEM